MRAWGSFWVDPTAYEGSASYPCSVPVPVCDPVDPPLDNKPMTIDGAINTVKALIKAIDVFAEDLAAQSMARSIQGIRKGVQALSSNVEQLALLVHSAQALCEENRNCKVMADLRTAHHRITVTEECTQIYCELQDERDPHLASASDIPASAADTLTSAADTPTSAADTPASAADTPASAAATCKCDESVSPSIVTPGNWTIIGSRVNVPGELHTGDVLRSQNAQYYAVLKVDGNFVVYASSHFVPPNALWHSNTFDHLNGKGATLELYANGKAVLISNKDHRPKSRLSPRECRSWKDVDMQATADHLKLSDDGILVLNGFRPDDKAVVALWATRSSRGGAAETDVLHTEHCIL
jgi:hypothetical protein